jgi:hypothetical protein
MDQTFPAKGRFVPQPHAFELLRPVAIYGDKAAEKGCVCSAYNGP